MSFSSLFSARARFPSAMLVFWPYVVTTIILSSVLDSLTEGNSTVESIT